jgi:hypothetical protein
LPVARCVVQLATLSVACPPSSQRGGVLVGAQLRQFDATNDFVRGSYPDKRYLPQASAARSHAVPLEYPLSAP